MSNDARLSTGLPGHPKTKKLIRRLGPGAAWHLVCLILWARDNRPDGDLSGMTGEDIELTVDWHGDNDAFVATLVDVGFLDGTENDYRLHDWADHQPWATGSEARSEKARWASLCRRHGRDEATRQMPEYAAKLATSTDNSATSKNITATSTDLAENSSAKAGKRPAPSPSPSPNPKAEEPPLSPQGGKRKREKVTFAEFVAGCRDAGTKPVPADDPIFAFADDALIPREFLELAWREFARKHRGTSRQQKDWRAHFRNAVRGNWGKVWYFPAEGESAALTTVGVQLKRERDAEAARRAGQQAEQAA